MLPLSLQPAAKGPLQVLCLGAHSDDIEIGCGGTILSLLAGDAEIDVHWVVLSSDGSREKEARVSAAEFLKGARRSEVAVKRFRNGYFPFVGDTIKDYFEELKAAVSPDVVFTHFRDDRHQDHRVVSDLTWNTFRDHTILEYEIPKYDGDLGSPNLFVPIDEAHCREKIRILQASFTTQRDKHWFDEATFRALMRLRGMESCAPSFHAEAFYARKIVMAPSAR
jgi:LmbE family N-acetylglucosaminyl deacetylase